MSSKGLGPKESQFFATILRNMRNKPDVDWEIVHKEAGYNSAAVAKERFRQIMKKLNEDNPNFGAQNSSSQNSNGNGKKKQSKIGSGTNLMPSRVTKPGAKANGKAKAGKLGGKKDWVGEEEGEAGDGGEIGMVKEEYIDSDGSSEV